MYKKIYKSYAEHEIKTFGIGMWLKLFLTHQHARLIPFIEAKPKPQAKKK